LENILEEIADGLYQIRIPLSFRLKYVHIFAALLENRLTLFDTGPDLPSTSSTLQNCLGQIGKSIYDIDRIFLTHFHVDHCGFAGRIKEMSGAVIHMSEIDFATLRLCLEKHRRIGLIRSFYRSHGLEEASIQAYERFIDAFNALTRPFTTENFLVENEILKVGKRNLRVLFTPGHTRGHVCFILPEEKILIAGDNILPHITPNLSPDFSLPSFLPLESYIHSLERIEFLPVKAVYPGHGLRFEDLRGRVKEIKEHHVQRKNLALHSLKEDSKTVCEVSRDIFGDDLPDFDRVLALNETYVHLRQLEKEGLIESTRREDKFLYWRVWRVGKR